MAVAPIGSNKKAITFAFNAKEGDISDLIETEKGFFVLRLMSKNDSGFRLLDQELKMSIREQLVKEKKGALLEHKLAVLVNAPDAALNKIAGSNAGMRLVTASDIRWSDGYIPGYGFDQPLVEAMSGLSPGKLSRPVRSSDGYAIVLVTAKTLPAGFSRNAQKAAIAPQLLKSREDKLINEYLASLRKSATIEDLRP